MRYAFLDHEGRVKEAINDDTVSELPEGAVELNDDQWADRFNLRAVGGDLIVDPIQPSLPAVKIPQIVTMRQARLALLQVGKLSAVNSAIAALPGADGEAARIEWEFSSTVERRRPLVAALGVGIGMSDADLDELFVLAAML